MLVLSNNRSKIRLKTNGHVKMTRLLIRSPPEIPVQTNQVRMS